MNSVPRLRARAVALSTQASVLWPRDNTITRNLRRSYKAKALARADLSEAIVLKTLQTDSRHIDCEENHGSCNEDLLSAVNKTVLP